MTRFVIGSGISAALLATAACSGSSSTGPSSPTASVATTAAAFSAQTLSSGVTSSTLDHGHGGSNSGSNSGRNDDRGHGREDQLEGTIASVDTAHKSFVVRGTTVNVLPETIIRHGHTLLTFADLVAGARVHVKGSADGAAVAAREITVQREDGKDLDDRDGNEVEGVVSGLAGTCPAITFNVGTLKVTTSATTIFRRDGCAAVINGAPVEVKGTVQSNGSLAASRVSAGHEEDDGDD